MGLLRLLLALSVVLFHSDASGLQFVGGGVAVEAFFIISGFYMSLILNHKYTGANGSYSLFISNRFLKLYPAYWAVLIAAILFQLTNWLVTGHPILLLYHIVHFNMDWPGIVLLGFTNIFIIGQDLISFIGLNRHTGELFFTANFLKTFPFLFNFLVIPQGWSLGIELSFYLLAPFILRKKLPWILLLTGAILLLRWWLRKGLHLNYDPWIYRFFPSQLLLFLLGNLSFRMYRYCQDRISFSKKLVYGLLVLVVLFTVLYDQIPGIFVKKTAYHALVCLSLPVLINMPKHFRADLLLGELSYPLYLSHMLVLNMITTFNGAGGPLSKMQVTALTILFSIAVSILLNRFVVQPVDAYRQSRIKR